MVKVIRREHAKDPSFLARFLDEARVQSQLTHPGVAQILEASMEADEPYVVVEYVEGRSLAEVRSRAIQMAARGWLGRRRRHRRVARRGAVARARPRGRAGHAARHRAPRFRPRT